MAESKNKKIAEKSSEIKAKSGHILVSCPYCHKEIPLTEALAAPLIEIEREKIVSIERERARVITEEEIKNASKKAAEELENKSKQLAELQEREKEREKKLVEAQKAQAELLKKTRELDDAKREMELTIEKRVSDEKNAALAKAKQESEKTLNKMIDEERERTRKLIEEERENASKKAAEELENKSKQLAEFQEREKEREQKLADAQKAQAEALKKERELDDKTRELELTIEKRVLDEKEQVRLKAKQEVDEQYKLKISEIETEKNSFKKKVDELQQKIEQGSQQLQGEVLELELEQTLSAKFPFDTIEPVPKGEPGADIMQRVFDPSHGQYEKCGTIIWESKRTKRWSDGWLAKLRDDQRAAGAEIAVLVSQVLPKNVESFDIIDGVWVISPAVVLPVCAMLRQSLIGICAARTSSQGAKTKAEAMYEYLTGIKFKQRIGAVVEAWEEMRGDLNTERKVIQKQWAKRETQINRVMDSTIGMYGDMQGIAGKSLQEIEGLEFKALE